MLVFRKTGVQNHLQILEIYTPHQNTSHRIQTQESEGADKPKAFNHSALNIYYTLPKYQTSIHMGFKPMNPKGQISLSRSTTPQNWFCNIRGWLKLLTLSTSVLICCK
jgi:hypothetical protein